jgi:diguanylate cyclase (GGDEF)-like protein
MKTDNIKVLVVDDDVIERKSIKRELTLKYSEYQVMEASTAEEAFVYIKNMSFDVIIIDYHMPQINGIEAIINLRTMAHLKHTAIVMISNNNDEQLMLDCINAGAQDFLLKSDVTENQLARTILQSRKRHELELQLQDSYQQVKHLAERDKLTGLHNRYYFDEALTRMLAYQKRTPDELIAVILFDLDKFKHINDTFGHEVGDKLLVAASQRILKILRGDELFARFGGDEFVLACAHLKTIRQIKGIIRRLTKAFTTPFSVDGHYLYCTSSIGVAISPINGYTGEELLKMADIAMYRAKKSSQKRYCLFEDNMQEAFLRKYKIESELRQAIKKNEFRMNYQPIVDVNTNKIIGAESLIRWPNGKTSKSPGEFIPIAEEAGLIQVIGKWVLQEVISYISNLLGEKKRDLYISINVSPCQLSDKRFTAFVESLLKSYKVPASSIVFEITETALLNEDATTLEALTSLHELGIRIALDDFGTGFSSISHLLICPINIVKVDKSIIQHITQAYSNHRSMLEGLAYMLNKLDIRIIAEGVETKQQAKLCMETGIELIQGYFYYKPVNEDDLYLLLDKVEEKTVN